MIPTSVLPPTRVYPSTPGPVSNPGSPQPLTDTSNSLKHPTGTEFQFHANEGTYILRDDFQLATPPPHPAEPAPTSSNPLSTMKHAPTAGTKISIVITSDKKAPPIMYNLNASVPNFSTFSIKEQEELRPSQETEAGSETPSQATETGVEQKAPAFGSTNSLLTATVASRDGSKKKRARSNMMKSSSSFFSRVVPHEALARRLNDRDTDAMFVFANINRAFQWLDITSESYFKGEHLTKILFTKAHMLCHDINSMTKSPNNIDVVVGTSLADIIWYEPFGVRYNRINKNGIINGSAISDVKWIPGSETLFLAAHMDGTLNVYDRDRDDAPFNSEDMVSTNGNISAGLRIIKSLNSSNQKSNPVASWHLSYHKINAFAFSPDCRHLAVVSQDGTLRIIDYLKEKLLDVYHSYYGGLTCVTWSPDGRYILTGGMDDLVTIWSLNERCIIARCDGHTNFVSAVAFDPWRCNNKNYRFGSVGEDGKLLLWDFNYNTLSKPKIAVQRIRNSISGAAGHTRTRADSLPTSRLRSNSTLNSNGNPESDDIEHAIISRKQTAELPPVMSKTVDDDPLSGLSFQQDCIITSCCVGHIRVWDRPKENVSDT